MALPEIGDEGQARLEAVPVHVLGDARAVATAEVYLERSGVTISSTGREVRVPAIRSGRPELEEAAAFVAGALAAVEAIKAVVGAGEAADVHVTLTGPEEAS
ncbi:MAG: hypothetical protein H6719_02690 [Sandaracinaceae bacterium]|nr:hypothetical protein [Sandaracinaceae bacterium]